MLDPAVARPLAIAVKLRARVVVNVAAGALVMAGCAATTSSTPASSAATRSSTVASAAADLRSVSGLGKADPPPWPVPADPKGRASAAGLPMGPMGMAEHYHPELRIIVESKAVEVPADIGVDTTTGQMSALHTHTPDGIIHVEAAQAGQAFTLGQLFTEWDVTLGPGQLGALRSDASHTLTTTVNGTAWTGDPATLRLAPDQKITLTYAAT